MHRLWRLLDEQRKRRARLGAQRTHARFLLVKVSGHDRRGQVGGALALDDVHERHIVVGADAQRLPRRHIRWTRRRRVVCGAPRTHRRHEHVADIESPACHAHRGAEIGERGGYVVGQVVVFGRVDNDEPRWRRHWLLRAARTRW